MCQPIQKLKIELEHLVHTANQMTLKNMENMRYIFRDISVTTAVTHSTTRPELYFITHIHPYLRDSFLSGCHTLTHQYQEYQSGRLAKRWTYSTRHAYMTRKIMHKITDSQNEEMLFGNCEVDELYMHRIECKEPS